jgi:hypothetical protein
LTEDEDEIGVAESESVAAGADAARNSAAYAWNFADAGVSTTPSSPARH